jgi:hypothetical protein
MKKVMSLIFAVIIIFTLSVTVIAAPTVRENGVLYTVSDNGEKMPYNGWTTVGGKKTYYYKNGVKVKGVHNIGGTIYRFGDDYKIIGLYTGKAKKSGVTVYVRNGKILEPTTTIEYEYTIVKITDPKLLEFVGGGWLKFDVYMDRLYSYFPIGAGYLEVTDDLYPNTKYTVYIPYSLAPIIYDADGFFGDTLIFDQEKLYNVMSITPIKNDKLDFYTTTDLLKASETYLTENEKQLFSSSEAKANTLNHNLYFYDGMSIDELDKYQAAALEYVKGTISVEDFDYGERLYGPLPYDHHYFRVTIVD